jgi:hypothetical protein
MDWSTPCLDIWDPFQWIVAAEVVFVCCDQVADGAQSNDRRLRAEVIEEGLQDSHKQETGELLFGEENSWAG